MSEPSPAGIGNVSLPCTSSPRPGFGKCPLKGMPSSVEKTECVARAIKCVRAKVPVHAVTNMSGGTAAQVSRSFYDDHRPARLRNQRGRRETRQTAANDDHVGAMTNGKLPSP